MESLSRNCVAAAFSLAMALPWSPAAAVTDVRYERWTQFSRTVPRDVVAPVESAAVFIVEFDAMATAGDSDPQHGLRFAIAERDADGDDILARFEVLACPITPAAGTALAMRAMLDLYCDAEGNLTVRDGLQWLVNWCDAPQARACISQSLQPAAEIGWSEPEAWELVVLDENDVRGSFPTPDDIVECGPIEPMVREFVAPDFASNGVIGIYADSAATVCAANIAPQTAARWYVIASLDGLARCGLSVMELGIEGLPDELFVDAVPNPHAVAFGNPFASGGLAFPCERGDGERIVLYTLNVIATAAVPNAVLRVGMGRPPSNFLWTYPWLELCPQFLGHRRRMLGRSFEINATAGADCAPPTRVAPVSWSRVKALYGS